MSGFIVVMRRDGTEVPPPIGHEVSAELQRYPHEAAGQLELPGFAAAQASRWYTQRDEQATLPWRSESGSTLVFCGSSRLDNAAGLAARFDLPAQATDAEIICRAYRELGDGFAAELLGDFGFALYDPQLRQLRLVRDHFGIRPLYYHLGPRECVVSDSIDLLLAHPGVPRELDEEVMTQWCLEGQLWSQERTFYRGIRKCPPASLVRVGEGDTGQSRYWDPAAFQPLPCKDVARQARHLRQLIDTAVAARVDTRHPMAGHSSGGLDCSVITILAGRRCRAAGQRFLSYNWNRAEEGDDPAHHEWAHAREIAHAEGFAHMEIGARAEEFRRLLREHDVTRDGTEFSHYERPLLKHAAEAGVRQVLSGFGGDEVLTHTIRDDHWPALRRGQALRVWRRMMTEMDPALRMKPLRALVGMARLLRRGASPTSLRARASRTAGQLFEARLELLAPPLRSLALGRPRNIDYATGETVRERQAAMLRLGYHQERLEAWAALGRRYGIRYLYPYLDKRIVEFALALPGDLYFREGQHRYLYRLALDDVLPASLRRKSKLPESRRVAQWGLALQAALGDAAAWGADHPSERFDAAALRRRLGQLAGPGRFTDEDGSIALMTLLRALLERNAGRGP